MHKYMILDAVKGLLASFHSGLCPVEGDIFVAIAPSGTNSHNFW